MRYKIVKAKQIHKQNSLHIPTQVISLENAIEVGISREQKMMHRAGLERQMDKWWAAVRINTGDANLHPMVSASKVKKEL
jgi:hypothetical protein